MFNRLAARLILAAGFAAAVSLGTGCQTSPGRATLSGGLPGSVDPMVANARDRVFPALVNIRVVTLSYYGGQESKGGGTGSGTIISSDGYVVTNAHVTNEGKRFFCTLADKQEIKATLVGEDPLTDLAVLKLDLSQLAPGTSLTVAQWGDSSTLQVGDEVLAMGSPFSLSRSVTLGIVSNTSRVFTSGFGNEELDEMELDYRQTTGAFTRWIQHDALINPGNSGGPLVNLRGEIIGVNTRGGSGMGFASPAILARAVADELIKNGSVTRSNFGMSFKAITKTGIKQGVLVNSVTKDGPAAKAGIKAGDVVTAIDAKPINVRFAEEIPELLRDLAGRPVGSTVAFTYTRDGNPANATVTTGKLLREIGDETVLRGWGISLSEITETIMRVRQLPNRQGVIVTGVRSGSPAETSEPRLDGGDIIKSVDGKPVNSFNDLVDTYRNIMTVDKPEQIPEFVLIEFDRDGQNQVTLLKPRPKKTDDPAGELPKAWLAIESQPVFRDLAKKLTKEGTAGFRVTRVYPNSSAATADLRPGDIIVGIDKDKLAPKGMQDAGQLQRRIRQMSAGDNAVIKIVRNGEPKDLPITLEKTRPTADEVKTEQNKDFELSVRDITFFDRDREKWTDDTPGVIVTNVERVGWAGLAGLSPGDLLQKVAGSEIKSVDDFRAVMAKLAKEQPERVVFVVLRNSRSSFLFAEPEWKPLTKDEAAKK